MRGPYYTGEEPFNFFLSVLFPDDQLMIMPYNRVVKDLNGYSREAFLQEVSARFDVTPMGETQYSRRKNTGLACTWTGAGMPCRYIRSL